MKLALSEPPRPFQVGRGNITILDCGSVALAPDEQITLVTEAGGEYDVTRKSWGFYAGPSLNARLPQFGLRAVLVRNPVGRYFVLLVERGHEAEFETYLDNEGMAVVTWLDTTEALDGLTEQLAK